jgi:uncharacterized membrane protein
LSWFSAKNARAGGLPAVSAWAFGLAYLLPVLLAVALATPVWQNPDEPTHMLRAVQVAHGELLGRREWGSAGGSSDQAIYDAYVPVQPVSMHPERRISLTELAASGAVTWHRAAVYTPFPNTVQYGPAFYVPDAFAYWAGRAAGLTVDRTMLLARACNALVFAFVTMLALTRARRALLPLACILLLPTSLALAASAGQDGLIFACTALVVATLDRMMFEQRTASRSEMLLVASLLVCIGMARPPYAAFLLVLWLAVPAPQMVWKVPAGAAAIILAWCIAVALHVSVRLGGADIGRQLALLGADPWQIPRIAMATARASGIEYAVQFIGVLGWTDTRLPRWFITGLGVVLVLAALAGTQGAARRPLLPLAGAMIATLAIFVLQYLTWTWPGQPAVTGVLGRYFLPVAMLLTLALPRLPIRVGTVACCAVFAQAIVTPAVMLHAIVLRYYIVR